MPSGSTFSNYLLIKEKVFKLKALGALCHPAATPCAGSRQGQDAGVAEAALGRGRGEAPTSGRAAAPPGWASQELPVLSPHPWLRWSPGGRRTEAPCGLGVPLPSLGWKHPG